MTTLTHPRSRLLRPPRPLVAALLGLCHLGAGVAAAVDRALHPSWTARVEREIEARGHPGGATLRRIWFGRTVREVLGLVSRVGLTGCLSGHLRVHGDLTVLQRPCVLATYHSDWWRFVGPCIPPELPLHVVGPGKWRRRLRGVEMVSPSGGMRRLLRYLRQGGSCVITVDHLRNPGPATRSCTLLGTEVPVPTTAARLAALAGIPLVPLTVRWAAGQLHVTVGSAIAGQGNPGRATEELFRILSGAIERDPPSWAQLHRFLRRAHSHPPA